MRSRPLRRVLFVGSVLAALSACGGTTTEPSGSDRDASASDATVVPSATDDATTSADAGVSDAPIVKARAIVQAYGGAAAGCATVPGMSVGDFGDGTAAKPARPVEDGATEGGATVTVKCRVAPRGTSTAIDATVTLGGTTFTLAGAIDASGKATDMTFALAKTARWTSTTCRLDTTVEPTSGVAAGRVWGSLACGGSTSDTGATCDIFGRVRLESCARE